MHQRLDTSLSKIVDRYKLVDSCSWKIVQITLCAEASTLEEVIEDLALLEASMTTISQRLRKQN